MKSEYNSQESEIRFNVSVLLVVGAPLVAHIAIFSSVSARFHLWDTVLHLHVPHLLVGAYTEYNVVIGGYPCHKRSTSIGYGG